MEQITEDVSSGSGKSNMSELPIRQAIFLIEHTVPLTMRGKVVRHFMATRKGDLEVFGLIYKGSRFFYFIYNGIVGIASNVLFLINQIILINDITSFKVKFIWVVHLPSTLWIRNNLIIK